MPLADHGFAGPDESGNPLFDVVFVFLDQDGPTGSVAQHRKLSECLGFPAPDGLTVEQIHNAHACIRYGHYFGRQVFLRNSYKIKDLLGMVVACAISDDPSTVGEVRGWADYNFARRIRTQDVKKLLIFDEVYEWAELLAFDLASSGIHVAIEDRDDVAP